MYIAPDSNIKIYKNVPLDNTYNHTLYFNTLAHQNTYFHGNQSILKYTLTAQSYQRVVKGEMRVEIAADNLYDCNYMAFQNAAFGSKWFYAFITSVEYVNNVTSSITFELDVMQTYAFDYELGYCFVEREHSVTDVIGDNIQAEPVNLGEYIYSDYEKLQPASDMLVLIMTSDTQGTLYEGIYSGAEIWAYLSTDTAAITAKLNSYISAPDTIIAVYMCPKALIPDVTTGGKQLTYSATSASWYISLDSVTTESQDFGGYTPKNNKLYTYPYNYLKIDNNAGQSLSLRYEFFDNFTPVLELSGTFIMPVQLVLRPCSYKGYPSYSELGGYTASKSECITLDSYPQCSWNVDTYKAWIAQNSVPIAITTMAGITNTAITTGVFSAAGVSDNALNQFGTFGVSNVSKILTASYSASIAANECKGTISNGNVNVAHNQQAFYKVRAHITADYARVIDDFFTMYGYATNKVKIPNRRSRPHWNYVKTNGCVLNGNAPADDIRKICQIYDNGVTFWFDPSEVGDYSLNNFAN